MRIPVNIDKEKRLQNEYVLEGINTLTEALATLGEKLALDMLQRQVTIRVQGLHRDKSQEDCEKWLKANGIEFTIDKDVVIPEPKAQGMTPEQRELRDYMKANNISLEELKAFREAKAELAK